VKVKVKVRLSGSAAMIDVTHNMWGAHQHNQSHGPKFLASAGSGRGWEGDGGDPPCRAGGRI
jgi:hypothetical protein